MCWEGAQQILDQRMHLPQFQASSAYSYSPNYRDLAVYSRWKNRKAAEKVCLVDGNICSEPLKEVPVLHVLSL